MISRYNALEKMPCRVARCRYRETHVTSAHRCGTCGALGHGQIECGKESAIRVLAGMREEEMPPHMWCDVEGCPSPSSHSTSAHYCHTCGERGGMCACMNKRCPTCNAVGKVDASVRLFTGAACCVCMDEGPVVLFRACGHANVCQSCVERL